MKADLHRERWNRWRSEPRAISDDESLPGFGERRVQLALEGLYPRGGECWDIRRDGDTWRLFRSELFVDTSVRLLGCDEWDASADLLEGFFLQLQAVKLRLAPLDHEMGKDGTVVQLAWSVAPAEVRFQWWLGAAGNWGPLERIVESMTQTFRGLKPKTP